MPLPLLLIPPAPVQHQPADFSSASAGGGFPHDIAGARPLVAAPMLPLLLPNHSTPVAAWVQLPDGEEGAVLGQGSFQLCSSSSHQGELRQRETAAMQFAYTWSWHSSLPAESCSHTAKKYGAGRRGSYTDVAPRCLVTEQV